MKVINKETFLSAFQRVADKSLNTLSASFFTPLLYNNSSKCLSSLLRHKTRQEELTHLPQALLTDYATSVLTSLCFPMNDK